MATQSNGPPARLVCLGFTPFKDGVTFHQYKHYINGKKCRQSARIYESRALAKKYTGCDDIRAVFVKVEETTP